MQSAAAGLEPISRNPVTLHLAYLHDATKFIAANETFAAFKDIGRLKWVPHGTKVPDGWTHIDDNIARRYFPRDVAQVTIGGKPSKRMVEAGRYAADPHVARLINNSLSVNRVAMEPTLNGILWGNHRLNAVQLGLSAWHAMFVGIDSSASEAALAISKAARVGGQLRKGDVVGAARSLAQAAKHSLTAPLAAGKYLQTGRQFYKAGQGTALERQLAQGGANLNVRGQYFLPGGWGSWERFGQAWRQGNIGGAIVQFPFAVIDGSMRPLFEYAIPRVKVGAFAALMKSELERVGPREPEAQVARRVWANVENRLGELNYDNLFWNNTFKAASQATFRAVGFNVGTVRELGGGILVDTPRALAAMATGKAPELTPKMQYLLGLGMTVAGLGAVYHKLHTGKMPERLVDYFYPKNGEVDENGNEVRVQLPTYFKDYWGVTHHPLTTIRHKLSPAATTFIELLSNRDFMGDMIYNEGAGLGTKAKQVATYLIQEARPFGFQQSGLDAYLANKLLGTQFPPGKLETSGIGAEGLLGVAKAPREVTESPALTAMLQERQQTTAGRGPRTPELKAVQEQHRREQATLQQAMGFKLRPEDKTMRQLPVAKREQLRAQFPQIDQRPGDPDPVAKELTRVGVLIPQADRKARLGGRSYDLPPDVATKVATQQGQRIRRTITAIMASPLYQQSPLATQKKVIQRAITRVRGEVVRAMRPEYARLLKQGALQRDPEPRDAPIPVP